jgi:hypothetical protein
VRRTRADVRGNRLARDAEEQFTIGVACHSRTLLTRARHCDREASKDTRTHEENH